MTDYAVGDAGLPRYYAEDSPDAIRIAPKPAADGQAMFRVVTRPPVLSEANPMSWLATHLPDALLYACLIHAEEYLIADERAVYWNQRYSQQVLPAAKVEMQAMLRERL